MSKESGEQILGHETETEVSLNEKADESNSNSLRSSRSNTPSKTSLDASKVLEGNEPTDTSPTTPPEPTGSEHSSAGTDEEESPSEDNIQAIGELESPQNIPSELSNQSISPTIDVEDYEINTNSTTIIPPMSGSDQSLDSISSPLVMSLEEITLPLAKEDNREHQENSHTPSSEPNDSLLHSNNFTQPHESLEHHQSSHEHVPGIVNSTTPTHSTTVLPRTTSVEKQNSVSADPPIDKPPTSPKPARVSFEDQSNNNKKKPVKKRKSPGFSILDTVTRYMVGEKIPSPVDSQVPMDVSKSTSTPRVREYRDVFVQTSEIKLTNTSTMSVISTAIHKLEEVRKKVGKTPTRASDALEESEVQAPENISVPVAVPEDSTKMDQVPTEEYHWRNSDFSSVVRDSLEYPPDYVPITSPKGEGDSSDSNSSASEIRSDNMASNTAQAATSSKESSVLSMSPESKLRIYGDQQYPVIGKIVPSGAQSPPKTPKRHSARGTTKNKTQHAAMIPSTGNKNEQRKKSSSKEPPPQVNMEDRSVSPPHSHAIAEHSVFSLSPQERSGQGIIQGRNPLEESITPDMLQQWIAEDRMNCAKCDLFEYMIKYGGEKVLRDKEMRKVFKKHKDFHTQRAMQEMKNIYKWAEKISDMEPEDEPSPNPISNEVHEQEPREPLKETRDQSTNTDLDVNIQDRNQTENRSNSRPGLCDAMVQVFDVNLNRPSPRSENSRKDQGCLTVYYDKYKDRHHCQCKKSGDNKNRRNSKESDDVCSCPRSGSESEDHCKRSCHQRNRRRSIDCNYRCNGNDCVIRCCNRRLSCNCSGNAEMERYGDICCSRNGSCSCNTGCQHQQQCMRRYPCVQYNCRSRKRHFEVLQPLWIPNNSRNGRNDDLNDDYNRCDNSGKYGLKGLTPKLKRIIKEMVEALSEDKLGEGESNDNESTNGHWDNSHECPVSDDKETQISVYRTGGDNKTNYCGQTAESSNQNEFTSAEPKKRKRSKNKGQSILTQVTEFMIPEVDSNHSDQNISQAQPTPTKKNAEDLDNGKFSSKGKPPQPPPLPQKPDQTLPINPMEVNPTANNSSYESKNDEGTEADTFNMKDPQVQEFVENILTVFCHEYLNGLHQQQEEKLSPNSTTENKIEMETSATQTIRHGITYSYFQPIAVKAETGESPNTDYKPTPENCCCSTFNSAPRCPMRNSKGTCSDASVMQGTFPYYRSLCDQRTPTRGQQQRRGPSVNTRHRGPTIQNQCRPTRRPNTTPASCFQHGESPTWVCPCAGQCPLNNQQQNNTCRCGAFTYIVPKERMHWQCHKLD